MSFVRQLIDIYFLGKHRLRSIKLLPLGSTLEAAVELYGTPTESQTSQDAPEIMTHTFTPSCYHDIHIAVWRDKIQSITYWSVKADPTDDLKCVFEVYGEAHGWRVISEGYWYQRSDDEVKLWCSAVPAIGIAYTEFLRTKSELETKHSLTLLDQIEDVTLAPDNAIMKLQDQFVRGESRHLLEFAGRSERIAVSPDGHCVFIVRRQLSYSKAEGVGEDNQAPETGSDTAEVIYVFSWNEGCQSWGKIALPRDAHVDLIRFEGDQCELKIRRGSTGKVLAWNAPVQTIKRLQGIGIFVRPMTDEGLWRELEAREAASGD